MTALTFIPLCAEITGEMGIGRLQGLARYPEDVTTAWRTSRDARQTLSTLWPRDDPAVPTGNEKRGGEGQL